MKFLTQLLQRLNVNKVLALIILVMIIQNCAGFRLMSLKIQCERLNKKICIEELIPNPPPLEVIR